MSVWIYARQNCRRNETVIVFWGKECEMEKSNIMIRLEKKEEHQKVENLVRESFWNVYCLGCLEHYVLHQLWNDPAFVPELDQSNGKCSYETDKNLLDDYLKWFCEENAIW